MKDYSLTNKTYKLVHVRSVALETKRLAVALSLALDTQ